MKPFARCCLPLANLQQSIQGFQEIEFARLGDLGFVDQQKVHEKCKVLKMLKSFALRACWLFALLDSQGEAIWPPTLGTSVITQWYRTVGQLGPRRGDLSEVGIGVDAAVLGRMLAYLAKCPEECPVLLRCYCPCGVSRGVRIPCPPPRHVAITCNVPFSLNFRYHALVPTTRFWSIPRLAARNLPCIMHRETGWLVNRARRPFEVAIGRQRWSRSSRNKTMGFCICCR